MLKKLYKNTEEISEILKEISNPDRLAILCYIHKGEKNVWEIVEYTWISQPQVSQHLSNLKEHGILESKRDWRKVLYKIKDKKILKVMASLKDIYCE